MNLVGFQKKNPKQLTIAHSGHTVIDAKVAILVYFNIFDFFQARAKRLQPRFRGRQKCLRGSEAIAEGQFQPALHADRKENKIV